jgi:polyphosphate kinase
VLLARQTELFHGSIVPALAAEGIRFSTGRRSTSRPRSPRREFEQRVFPVLTPLAVDPAHPFPYISNLSMNLAVEVREPGGGETHFARVKVPPVLPRFVVLPDGERFVPLEQVIAAHLDRLFPGLQVADHHVFRVTRNADFEVEEDEADDLLLAIESELNRRRFGRVVRLELESGVNPDTLDLLRRELALSDDEIHVGRARWASRGCGRCTRSTGRT